MRKKYCIKELEKITELSKSTIYKKIDEESFPPPIKRGRYSYWYEDVIDLWIEIQDTRQSEWEKKARKSLVA